MRYVLFTLSLSIVPLCARDFAFEKLYGTVNHCYKKECRKAIASSFLIEKGKPKGEYSPDKIQDFRNENWRDTAWCVSKNQGIGEYIYVSYSNNPRLNKYKDIWKREGYSFSFTIINGFVKNKDLFLANNRVKKIAIEVQEIAYTMSVQGPDTITGTDIEIFDGPILNGVHEIELVDKMDEQEFKINVVPVSKRDGYLQMDLLLKMTIKEIYPGNKYKDTCISDARFEMVVPEDKKK
ncbi:NADase-type glycan-binding domain-containing protein [Leptospira idonii]|uniref:NAD glycohydrolase translocation F5/8 type C domain-containing protein n=1 Tax=Leptospira idonii TaxID=1193500 RepID=A0A4R9M542_9LEPT|nr:hypothetical protein [Leptospira idonii]TGN20827.1 hypothetical protein EHS15_01740 [Leptospira idonii]